MHYYKAISEDNGIVSGKVLMGTNSSLLGKQTTSKQERNQPTMSS